MVNNAVVSHNSVNELYYLEEVDSTNTWAKANLDKFGPVGAVYTTSQTAGRGRRGHTWINASGQALYYTVVLKTELAQPESLPLFASMAVADALEQRYGIQCQIKWPNDLLLNGKKDRRHSVRGDAGPPCHCVWHWHQSGPAAELF